MMEYLNMNALVMTIVLSIIIVIMDMSRKKESFLFLYFLITVMLTLLIFDANDKFKTTNKNMQLFRGDTTLKCFSGGGLYSSANYFRVSAKDGWELDKKYFIKDSVMIPARMCELW